MPKDCDRWLVDGEAALADLQRERWKVLTAYEKLP
jgi:hypothetical protein